MIINTMSNEFKLLISCLQAIDSNQEEGQLPKLSRDVANWDHFVKLVLWHRVTPLVYKVLNEYYSNHIPSPVMSRLKVRRDENTLRVMRLTGELLILDKLFQTEGIPFIPFKGPLMAQRIYGDLTLREPRDLDLLIPENHIITTHKLLLEQGYQLYLAKQLPNNLALFSRNKKDIEYIHPSKKIKLEIHWRFFNNPHEFIVPINKLFNSAETHVLSGVSFSQMPSDIELLYLIYHGSTHSWRNLCWLYDIKQYVNQMVVPNWTNLLDLAKEMKVERSFLEGLTLTNQFLQIPLDPIIDTHIQLNKRVKSITQTSTFMLMQSKSPTLFMRLKMLKSRFQFREYSLPFYKAFFERLMLRIFRVI